MVFVQTHIHVHPDAIQRVVVASQAQALQAEPLLLLEHVGDGDEPAPKSDQARRQLAEQIVDGERRRCEEGERPGTSRRPSISGAASGQRGRSRERHNPAAGDRPHVRQGHEGGGPRIANTGAFSCPPVEHLQQREHLFGRRLGARKARRSSSTHRPTRPPGDFERPYQPSPARRSMRRPPHRSPRRTSPGPQKNAKLRPGPLSEKSEDVSCRFKFTQVATDPRWDPKRSIQAFDQSRLVVNRASMVIYSKLPVQSVVTKVDTNIQQDSRVDYHETQHIFQVRNPRAPRQTGRLPPRGQSLVSAKPTSAPSPAQPKRTQKQVKQAKGQKHSPLRFWSGAVPRETYSAASPLPFSVCRDEPGAEPDPPDGLSGSEWSSAGFSAQREFWRSSARSRASFSPECRFDPELREHPARRVYPAAPPAHRVGCALAKAVISHLRMPARQS